MEQAAEADARARAHARRTLRPLMATTFYGWADRHAAKAERRDRAEGAREAVQLRRHGRVLRAWRLQVQARKHQDAAFGLVMR